MGRSASCPSPRKDFTLLSLCVTVFLLATTLRTPNAAHGAVGVMSFLPGWTSLFSSLSVTVFLQATTLRTPNATHVAFGLLSFLHVRTSPCFSLSVTVSFLHFALSSLLVITRFTWDKGLTDRVRGNQTHRLHHVTDHRLVEREQESIALRTLSREDVNVDTAKTRTSVSSAPP